MQQSHYGNLIYMMMISVSNNALCKDGDMGQQSCSHEYLNEGSMNDDLDEALMMMMTSTARRGLMSSSWSGLVGQGSLSWYSSIGISIKRIVCGFSSPRGRGFGPGRKPISCVLVSLFW